MISAAQQVGRWAIAALALALGLRLVTLTIADQIAAAQPETALLLDPWNARAGAALAGRRLAADDPHGAREAAAAALAADPLSTPALARLAQAAQQAGAPERAADLVDRLGAASPRDLYARSALLDRALREGDAATALSEIELIFRGQNPARWGAIAAELLPVLTAAGFVAPLAARLAAGPPWREWLVTFLAQRGPDLDGLDRLFDALAASPAPPTLAELRPYLARLIAAGRIEQAYVAWLKSLPKERLAGLPLLYNADFRFGASGLPFDWTFAPVQGAQVEVLRRGGERVLAVDFFGGRVPFRHVTHLTVLPPGKYVFSGRQRAEGLQTSRGLRWRLFCLAEPNGSLAETPLLRGEAPWSAFAAEFEVGEACPTQSLQLELPARVVLEQEISGTAFFTGLDIRPK